MKIQRYDIGGEIISILTRGMYPDPRDAVREYIQNSIDADADNVSVKVRGNAVTVQDNGIGMNHTMLRKAVRLGISEKNPSKDVGFMGIGIYSAFHLCEVLDIYSRGSEDIPNRLTIDFGGMKTKLEEQKELRLKDEIEPDQLIDLQGLLEEFITITENGEFPSEQFPSIGTRIELLNLDPSFSNELSEFEVLASYLRDVIPLKFEPEEKFKWGPYIEKTIIEKCAAEHYRFELINLTLQVNSRTETLYRPYRNADFNSKITPQEPLFQEISKDGVFYAVMWGCLNGVRKVVDTKKIAGFILKKQGFSIGNRENMVKHFPRGKTFFDRYIGEIIIVNPDLLPNAARNDLEYNTLRVKFYDALQKVAELYDEAAQNFQEWTKADEELSKIADRVKQLNADFNTSNDNTDILLNLIVKGNEEKENVKKRISRKALRPGTEDKANEILNQANALIALIEDKINALIEHKRASRNANASKTIAKSLATLDLPRVEITKYESLLEMLLDIDIEPKDSKMEEALSTLDDVVIADQAQTRAEYYALLNNLKDEILKRLDRE